MNAIPRGLGCDNPCSECVAANGCLEAHLDPGAIVHKTLRLLIELDLWWGHSRLGLILSSAFFNTNPVTTEDIAEMCGFSAETVRRYLKPLMNVGRVEMIKEGRNVRYKAHRDWAIKTRALLMRNRDEVNAELDSGQMLQGDQRWVFPKRLVPYELSDDAPNTDDSTDDPPIGFIAIPHHGR
jgi:DNA-binding transcriptional ArsR family regulator